MKFCMHGGTAGTLKSYAEKWFALWVAGDLTFLHTFACCCPFCLSACSTKGAPWAPAFRTMSESKALTKKRPSIQDSTGGVFESVFRCIGHRQCHEICTLVTPRLFEHRERGAATSMFQSHAYIIIICILWDRLQILQHWAAMPSWLSTQAFVAARDIFHGGASMCFSQQYCSDNAVLSGFSQVPFDHVDHLRYFGDFASKTPIFWHHFPLICCRVFANRAPRHQNGLVYSSIPVTWQ